MIERQKIAIIGGGASGLITGYLLSKKHDITIYEKEAILGGNVRTLNKNVRQTDLPSQLNIENGVLGFSQSYYPNFHKLLDRLGVSYHSLKPSISLFSEQFFFPARLSSYFNANTLLKFLTNYKYRTELWQLKKSQKDFKGQIEKSKIKGLTFEDFQFPQTLYKEYMQALFMLSFSTTFALVSQLPQSLLNPYFLSLPNSRWSFIKGGVYNYLETILKTTKMRIICNVKSVKISRKAGSINLKTDGAEYFYDAVIIATTPGSVKNVLMDMSEEENKIFKDWDDQTFSTIAHKDLSFYGAYKKVNKTPMDLFSKFHDSTIGYNTYQNTVYNLKTKDPYSFAYNLDNIISKEKVLHRADHIVPKYCKNYDDKIRLLQTINGNQNTFFAGAYMGNGLHEGAVVSAMNISSKLGGMNL